MLQQMVNFSVFSVEDFYHPNLFHFYKIFWEVSLIIMTIFFIFTLYMILKSSKEIEEYKYFIINQLVWSYLFNLVLGMWQPVTLWPFYMGFGIGWFRYWNGIWAIIPFYTVVVLGIGVGVSFFISVIHWHIYIFSDSYFGQLYEPVIFKLLLYGFIFIFAECSIITPILSSYVDTYDLRESITSKYPVMTFFFENEPSIFGYDPSLNNHLTISHMFLLLIGFVGLILLFILMYFNFIRLMKKYRYAVSTITCQIELILFRVLFVQLFLILGMLALPYFLSIFLAFLGVRYVFNV